MKILSLHIDGFGKLNDLDLSFEDGLNVLYGKNEAGKSTLHTFIRGMLFGIERQRGRASKNDTYSRFEPWSGTGAYQGWLRLESQGEIFRIERRFQKGNKSLTIINETKGCEETPTAALWERLRCGLSETAYSNTISIGQLKSATDGGMVSELRNYIANLNTSGSIALNITKASALLKSQRREMAAKLVPEAAKRYTALLSEVRTIEHEISDPRYQNRLASCQADLTQIKEELETHRTEKESLLEKTARGRQILIGSHFTDEASLQEMWEMGKVIEKRTYHTMYGPWSYATVDDGQIDLREGNILMIGTLESYQSIRSYFGRENTVPLYIEVEDGERLERALNREKQQKCPRYAELCRRFLADEEDFSEEKLAEAGITAQDRYENRELEKCLDDLAQRITGFPFYSRFPQKG